MSQDGINGTDNIQPLFPDRPSASPIPPQPDIVEELEAFAQLAVTGKITGLIILGFDQFNNVTVSLKGQIPFKDGVTALEQVKFGILARDYAAQNIGPK